MLIFTYMFILHISFLFCHDCFRMDYIKLRQLNNVILIFETEKCIMNQLWVFMVQMYNKISNPLNFPRSCAYLCFSIACCSSLFLLVATTGVISMNCFLFHNSLFNDFRMRSSCGGQSAQYHVFWNLDPFLSSNYQENFCLFLCLFLKTDTS